MKSAFTRIILYRLIVLTIGVLVFAVKPILEAVHIISDLEHEISQVDVDNETEEGKKQEKDKSEDTILYSSEDIYNPVVETTLKSTNYNLQKAYLSCVVEIQIPPPRG